MEEPTIIKQQPLSPSSPYVASRGFNGVALSSATIPNSNIASLSTHSTKRKRSTMTGMEHHSSPGSPGVIDDEHAENEKKRQPGVKRACNECRQQKLRCTVVQDPFQPCQRCTRLKLECKIESNFKRVGKRSKHAEMEKEIERLRRNIQRAKDAGYVFIEDDDSATNHSPVAPYAHTRNTSMVSDGPVSSMLSLNNGQPQTQQHAFPPSMKYAYELEDVKLTEDDTRSLFAEFFAFYHPFLPFLNHQQAPDQYYSQHPLLFWAIIAVASRRYSDGNDRTFLSPLAKPLTKLIWNTIGDVPSNYHVVKALCLLCTWPLPTSSSAVDPTHILCGVMMKIATMIGLHRPNHMQDFSRVSIDLDRDQLHDRVVTWAVCNIVAQTVGTGYGQPASTLYDWTLAVVDGEDSALKLPMELESRLMLERFCDKVSKEMYSNASDPRGVAGDGHRAMLLRVFRRDFNELKARLLSRNVSPIVKLHLSAANLHLRLAGFYDSSTTPGYLDDLMALYRSTEKFLKDVLETEKVTSPNEVIGGGILSYCTTYIQQMLVAASFTLLKLLKSFFVRVIDPKSGKQLFNRAVEAIRHTSVIPNDLQSRLAELMVQMWNGTPHAEPSSPDDDTPLPIDDSLQLKVRCRHSMSLVFDTIWRWREEFQEKGRGDLDIKHPTNVDTNEAILSSLANGLGPPPAGLGFLNGSLTPTDQSSGLPSVGNNPSSIMNAMNYNEPLYDTFDPQNWMLDGLVDFQLNYSLANMDGT
ncbi:Regulatory protein LEU3 [Ceratocystis lukuohia]